MKKKSVYQLHILMNLAKRQVCHEDIGTAGWLLEQFKYFLKACGYANETVDKLIFLEYGEKVVNANGEVIYEYK